MLSRCTVVGDEYDKLHPERSFVSRGGTAKVQPCSFRNGGDLGGGDADSEKQLKKAAA